MKNVILLPCPFGCPDKYQPYIKNDRNFDDGWSVACEYCESACVGKESKEEAIEFWNTRNNKSSIDYQNGYIKGIFDAKELLNTMAKNLRIEE